MKQFQRMIQKADQTFRSGKSEAKSDELQRAERKIEQMRNVIQNICKKLAPVGGTTGQLQDPAMKEKKLKKIPKYIFGMSLQDTKGFDEDTLFKGVLQECGTTEVNLANILIDHDCEIETNIFDPFNTVNNEDFINISKSKKALAKLFSEKDSAHSRYMALQRQYDQNPNIQTATKVRDAEEEWKDIEIRLVQLQDAHAVELFGVLSKETKLSNAMLEYLKLQHEYHKTCSLILENCIPRIESRINESPVKPVFGFPLEEHLRLTGRTIAYPIEVCVCSLHELGLLEEGVLRLAASNTRVKRLKLSFDSGIFKLPLPMEYRDVHAIAGVLKQYLRELPEPLLTHRFYDSFISVITKNNTDEARLTALWSIVHQLPRANLDNLRYILKFLSTLTKNQAVNKMTPANIAIVIAPNLLKCPEDTNGLSYDMSNTANVNSVVELLITHADWFFQEEVNFFLSFSREDLLPDLYEFGFTPSFGSGIYNHSYNPVDPPNGDNGMSKSMFEYSSGDHHNPESIQPCATKVKQSHSRSSSNDTNLINVDSEIKDAQSNSSLSDHSTPPPRRRHKQLAPAPPTVAATDANKTLNISSPVVNQQRDVNKNVKNATLEIDKPGKPPRPLSTEIVKPVVGVQTLNRVTHKNKERNPAARRLSSSRDNLNDIGASEQRCVFDFESELIKKDNSSQTVIMKPYKVTASPEHSISQSDSTSIPKDLPRPVAAPRTIIPVVKADSELDSDVVIRPKTMFEPPAIPNKPMIPERPAGLRPQSFRAPMQKKSSMEMLNIPNENSNSISGEALLERTHVYSVDKQQPTFIQVGNLPQGSDLVNSGDIGPVQADAPIPDQTPLTSHMRKLSQSEGNILDVPPSPRLFHKPPPRPQIPAPPPPTAYVSQKQIEVIESTNL